MTKRKTGPDTIEKPARSGKKSSLPSAREFESRLLRKIRTPREDRHVLVALVLASLVAGLLFVVNCDRSTNAVAASQLGGDVSLHGWPFIYLQRHFDSLPAYLAATRISDWPLPVNEEETREMNYGNLILDLIIAATIVIASYFLVRGLVFRYDRWKKTWAD